MLRLLADENFNGDVLRGLMLRQPGLDIVRVQDVGLSGADDPEILAWAAENDRIVLTHDRATMSDHAYDRVAAGEEMAGVFILHDRLPIGTAIEELLIMFECSEQEEWRGRAVQESERQRWLSEICPVDHEAFWWYGFAWWILKEGPAGDDVAVVRQNEPVPEGGSYWIVESAVQWGSLAGGANHELWRWDGRRAEFVELFCVDSY